MKKLFSFHALMNYSLALAAMAALVAGLKEGVNNTEKAEFFPVAVFGITLAYLLGFTTWKSNKAWLAILVSGLVFVFAESSRLIEPIQIINRAIPTFEIDFLRWFFQKENAEILFPDVSVFQMQFAQLSANTSAFLARLSSGAIKHASIREFIWDLPLLFISAWAGWGISRRKQILWGFSPALALHAYLLYYTGKDALTLQIHVFTLILLMGFHQRVDVSADENTKRAARETYSALTILAVGTALLAGFIPSISITNAPQQINQNALVNSLGLVGQIPRASVPRGLPRQHLIELNAALSKKVIFIVKTGELPASENLIIKETIPRHYWRWLTYDVYNGRGWATSQFENKIYAANALIQPVNPRSKMIHLQVEKSAAQDNRVYWTGALIKSNATLRANWRTQPQPNPLVADMLGATVERQRYQADALIPAVSANELRAAPRGYPLEIQKYLAIPKSTPQRVIELAFELTNDKDNPYDKAKALEFYLRTYPYSLHIPPPPADHDVVDYFLFDLKTGYCDYYATSMIILARAVGIPARLVIGYSSGTYNAKTAEYIVREENAHSWVEVYFTGIGWIEFEPTASQMPLIIPDSLNAEKISGGKVFSSLQPLSAYAQMKFLLTQHLFSLIFIFMFGLIVFVLWFLYTQGFLKSHKTIRSIYQYVFYHGKKINKGALKNQTPSAFAEKLKLKFNTQDKRLFPAMQEIEALTDLYMREIYSADFISIHEYETAIKLWRKLFWRLLYARIILK